MMSKTFHLRDTPRRTCCGRICDQMTFQFENGLERWINGDHEIFTVERREQATCKKCLRA